MKNLKHDQPGASQFAQRSKGGLEHPLGSWPTTAVLGMALAGLLLSLSACAPKEVDVTLFKDITSGSGLDQYEGMTHGAAWGDYDGDGRPDLYVTNHLKPAVLFLNLGGGRFEDVTTAVLGDQTGGDKHGAAWADFDNDGDQDLVQLTGAIEGVGEEPKHLFVNRDGKLLDEAGALGVDNPQGRTRMPLWLDLNGDGRLDLFQGAEARFDTVTPPFLFTQGPGHFQDSTPWLPLESRSAPFCILAQLNDDPAPEIVCRLMGANTPNQVFDTRSRPAKTLDILPKTAFEDAVAGDFDNDGAMDLFLARKTPGGRLALARSGDRTVTVQVELTPKNQDKMSAFHFRTTGPVHFTFSGQHTNDLAAGDIHYGGKGAHPKALSFDLDKDAVAGMPTKPAAPRPAVLIGSPKAGLWQVEFHIPPEAFGGKQKPHNLSVRIHSEAPIEDLEALGDSATDETAPQRLFINKGGKLVEESDKRGVNERAIGAANVVAADFDNDMDLDLFILGTGDAGKAENLLLLNDGKGHFKVAHNAGGAAGMLVGVGDSVTAADVDGDGFLDLLTASGASMGRTLGLPSNNGRYQLFHNIGNGNNWLMIDLVGSRSNRNGIGAMVMVVAGGITQTRLQDGGVHERGQNHARLHFGLGPNDHVDTIRLRWPSGKEQVLTNVPADRVLSIKEPE